MKATIRDIARKAGVTTATVSYVLNRKPNSRISEKTRDKVLRAAENLKYCPDLHARSLATGRSYTLAAHFVWPLDLALHDPYAIDVLRGVIKRASEADYAVQVAVQGQPPKHRGVDGWICVQAREPLAAEISQDSPVLYLDPGQNLGTHCYWAKNKEAGELVADKTAPHHGRALFVLHDPLGKGPLSYDERYESFRGAFTARHGSESVHLDHLHPDSPVADYRAFAEKWVPRIRQLKISLIICVSDMLASRIQQLMQGAGLRIPDNLGIVGFDNTSHSQVAVPNITTVDMGAEQLGMAAVQYLLDRIEGRKTKVMTPAPRWIERASCPID